MRITTLTLSIVAHVIGAGSVIIAPLFATDTLPEPRTATEFIHVVPLVPPSPPQAKVAETPRHVTSDAAPLSAPEGIAAEPLAESTPDARALDDGVITFGDSGSPFNEPAPPAPPPAPAAPPHVGGQIQPPRKIVDVAPVYPPIARAAHAQGVVILEALIGEDGSVRDVRVLRSLPLLDAAAIDAVKQWRFTPTLLNDQPIAVVMTVTVAFTLR